MGGDLGMREGYRTPRDSFTILQRPNTYRNHYSPRPTIMKPRNEQILKTHSELNTYDKPLDLVFIDGEKYSFTPKPSKKKPYVEDEESEQSKRIRAEVYGEFRQFGSMPILWKDMKWGCTQTIHNLSKHKKEPDAVNLSNWLLVYVVRI